MKKLILSAAIAATFVSPVNADEHRYNPAPNKVVFNPDTQVFVIDRVEDETGKITYYDVSFGVQNGAWEVISFRDCTPHIPLPGEPPVPHNNNCNKYVPEVQTEYVVKTVEKIVYVDLVTREEVGDEDIYVQASPNATWVASIEYDGDADCDYEQWCNIQEFVIDTHGVPFQVGDTISTTQGVYRIDELGEWESNPLSGLKVPTEPFYLTQGKGNGYCDDPANADERWCAEGFVRFGVTVNYDATSRQGIDYSKSGQFDLFTTKIQ